MANAVDY